MSRPDNEELIFWRAWALRMGDKFKLTLDVDADPTILRRALEEAIDQQAKTLHDCAQAIFTMYDAAGGDNYCEALFERSDGQKFALHIQRVDGLTPAQRVNMALVITKQTQDRVRELEDKLRVFHLGIADLAEMIDDVKKGDPRDQGPEEGTR